METFPHIRAAAATDTGRRRKNNEDAFGVWREAGIFCVADGMGGGDDGEIASNAIVRGLDSLAPLLRPRDGRAAPFPLVLESAAKAMNAVSEWIYNRAVRRQLKGCGSTFVGVAFDATNPASAAALHAGDSRLYLFREGQLMQVTKDHSAAELISAKDEKEINPIFRGMILRAVGIKTAVQLERTPFEVRENDCLLLCSDGLYRMVSEEGIAAILGEGADEKAAASALVDAANEAGGIDNVTAVVLRIGQLPPPMEADLGREAPEIASEQFEESPSGTDSAFSDAGERATSGVGFGEESDEGVETTSNKSIIGQLGNLWSRIVGK